MATRNVNDWVEESLVPSVTRIPIQLIVIGQSNERGNVAVADRSAYPTAFQSARNAGVSVPIAPAVTRLGGWWTEVYDQLWDWGYDLHIVNAGMGGASFLYHLTNYPFARQNNYPYSVQRLPVAFPDRGDFGELVSFGGKIFVCTGGGRTRGAMWTGTTRSPWGTGRTDGPAWAGGGNSGSSAPDVSAVAIGDTVVDGSITWTRVDESLYNGSATYNPALNTYNSVLMPSGTMSGRGFDPLGILTMALEEAGRDKAPFTRRIAYVANGQSDLGVGAVTYGCTLSSLGTFFLQNGFDIMLGLTHFSPASGTTTQYGNLSTGVTNAITTLRGSWATDRVLEGANLYQLMGSTGPMAPGGAFLQADNIHVNGAGAVGPDVAGVSCAAKHVADKLKAVLPQRTVIG